MGKNSAIPWTDHTLNFWQGCHPVSTGCQNCYMYRDKKRYGQDPATVVRSKDATFYQARKWEEPAKVFVCSWSDFFIKEADPWREDAWNEIRRAPHLTWIILTKRPENIVDRLPADWGEGWPNVWLGVTAENQEQFDKRYAILSQIKAAVKFVSYEPAVGSLNVYPYLLSDGWVPTYYDPDNRYLNPPSEPTNENINWIVAGAESGPNRRIANIEWFRSLRDQCVTAGVPFFLKQMDINGELVKMPELDGVIWQQYPKEKE